MKIEELQTMAEEDFKITPNNLNTKIYEAPSLHSKYLNLYLNEKRKLFKLEEQKNDLYRELSYYYVDEWKYQLSVKEREFHVITDDRFKEINRKYKTQKALVEYLDALVEKSLKVSFDITNIREYLMYINGV